ncbi:ribulose-phosphate 3-epimerase [Pseudoxanthobacter soli DSM 19599]|uniref:Ribulose-phosphate 3-epimerase n=1 Tax=Pseudoxanthobacter soli DSM 19599 TaxID=1123029 RepID=A0A1M7ZNS6_9HYPH|nr:hypothetical protein [Pseudoxanthobacter soli]SHO66555.1 ribulose-phosphate 3-epimerase [Pseudoxanthobacter soli DSM 19599]
MGASSMMGTSGMTGAGGVQGPGGTMRAGAATHLSASVYAADPLHLADEIEAVLPYVESLHLDVMDGIFAPQYGLSVRVISDLAARIAKPLDVHLMVARPREDVIRFAELGVRSLAIHIESEGDFAELAGIARANGACAFAALRHTTTVGELERLAGRADGWLFLTAPAGGGAFDERAFERLSQRPAGLPTIVDGKIGPEHFGRLDALGVDLAVVGAALFDGSSARERARLFAERLKFASVRTDPT